MFGNLPDLDVLHLWNVSIVTEEMISRLPRSITNLTINADEMPSSALKPLPNNLKHLSCTTSVLLEDRSLIWFGQDFAFLPRSLTYLYINQSVDVEDEQLSLLPPNLRDFSCPECPKLTKKAISFLPIHCSFTGAGIILVSQNDNHRRLQHETLQDPDPRVIGRPFPWK